MPFVVVCDVRLRGKSGLEWLSDLRRLDQDLPVILITGHGDISMAVQAMRNGAYDFIEKPCSSEQLVSVVRRAAEKRRLTLEVRSLRSALADRQGIEASLLGRSPQIQEVRRLVSTLAATNVDVTIYGETGTGKEVVARCLHNHSGRRGGNYVAVNCGGLPESLVESELFGHEVGAFTGATRQRIGKIEYANGGTLFLDEIESMPLSVQVKLLRALQDRSIERVGSNKPISVDCRVVAASKTNLLELSEKKVFRADLYYRLGVAFIELPPLRERREDIPLLFEHFTLDAARRFERDAPIAGRADAVRPAGLFVAGKRAGASQRRRSLRARRARRQGDQQARVWRVGCVVASTIGEHRAVDHRGRAAAQAGRRSSDCNAFGHPEADVVRQDQTPFRECRRDQGRGNRSHRILTIKRTLAIPLGRLAGRPPVADRTWRSRDGYDNEGRRTEAA